MDVRLPDGTIIRNIPDNMGRAELTAKLKANGYDVSAWDKPTQPQPVDKKEAAQMALEGMSPGERVLANIGSGIADLNPFQSRAEVDDKRIRDAELNDTFAGKALNIAGQVVPTLALPFGLAARGAGAAMRAGGMTKAGQAVGSSAAADMMLTGTALGAAAPVGTNDSRLVNSGIGMAGGAVIPAAGAAYRGAKHVVAPYTRGGSQRIAGEALHKVGVPSNVVAQEIVPGSVPTLVEATQNPTVAQLEKTLANRNPNFRTDLGTRAAEQNIARWDELGRVTGTTDDIAAAELAREAKAIPILDSAMSKAKTPDTQALVDVVDMLAGGATRLRSNASGALADVRSKIAASRNASDLYAVRLEIDDMLSGRVGSDMKGAKYASKELLAVKGALDEALNKATNGRFGKYLEAYTEGSKPVNRMEAAQKFAGKFEAAAPDAFGSPTITHQRWRRAMAAPETMFDGARTSTKNKLSEVLNVGDVGLLDDIERDLMRSYQGQRLTAARGSDTVQNLEGNKLLMTLLSAAPKPAGTGSVLNALAELAANSRVRRPMAELERAALDPAYAAELVRLGIPVPRNLLPLLQSGGVNPLRMLAETGRTASGRVLASEVGQ